MACVPRIRRAGIASGVGCAASERLMSELKAIRLACSRSRKAPRRRLLDGWLMGGRRYVARAGGTQGMASLPRIKQAGVAAGVA